MASLATWYLGSSYLEAASSDLLILDSVSYNAGEKRFQTVLDNPVYEAQAGFNGKVLDLFDSPLLAVDWKDVDPRILPRFSPAKRWVDKKAVEIDRKCAEAKAAGLKVYAQCDLVLLPKSLLQLYRLQKVLGNPIDKDIEGFIRLNIQQAIRRFPLVDGYVIRIGETYTQGSPHHEGRLNEPRNIDNTIIPVIALLEDEICRKGGRALIVRTWMSFDDPQSYSKVDAAIVPQERLIFSVKHCEGDFHRRNPFSRIIGTGRHRQLIEVQCAREYEGKGAYPNYIANGVIEGFEEDLNVLGDTKIRSIRDFQARSPLFAGIWTWTRGGGWGGPFPSNELWCRLNAWCLAQWAKHPEKSEEEILERFAREELNLSSDDDLVNFRKLCLLSAAAVLRGKSSLVDLKLSPWWSRDDTINVPDLPNDPAVLSLILTEREESVKIWEEIVSLAGQIKFPDKKTARFVEESAKYGLYLYRIYKNVFELKTNELVNERENIRELLIVHEELWRDFESLCSSKDAVATPYRRVGSETYAVGEKLQAFIARLKKPQPR